MAKVSGPPRDRHCYCTECDADNSLRVQWENDRVVQPGSIGLCRKHAKRLALRLLRALVIG